MKIINQKTMAQLKAMREKQELEKEKLNMRTSTAMKKVKAQRKKYEKSIGGKVDAKGSPTSPANKGRPVKDPKVPLRPKPKKTGRPIVMINAPTPKPTPKPKANKRSLQRI